jgi:aromatic-L-amino-acid decarboxylase
VSRISGVEGNKVTAEMMDAMNDSGKVFLSSTSADGYFYIRVCINTYTTKKQHIDLLLSLVYEKVGQVR